MASELQVNTITEATSGSGITFAKDVIPATPLSHRNMMINGAMLVDQRNNGAQQINIGYTDNDYRTLDRWRNIWTGSGSSRNSLQQVAITDLAGFNKALKVGCVTAESGTQDAGESFRMAYRFEGQDLQGLEKGFSSAKPVTVSFWVKGTAGKTFVLELHQAKSTARHATQQFSVTSSWVRHSFTFPGDTTNTIDCNNLEGLELNLWLFAGSNYTSGTYTSKTWANVTTANRAVGISDSGKGIVNSTSDEVYFTGFQMELGSVATPFEHKSYTDELRRCQRYYYKPENTVNAYLGKGHMYATGTVRLLVPHPVTMRTASVTLKQDYGSQHFYVMESASLVGYMHTNWTIALNGENATCIGGGTADGHYTAGNGADVKISESTGYLALSAEL